MLSETTENYLEQVLMLSRKKPEVHQSDVCAAMNYSRPTVSVVLRDLAKDGYLSISESGGIALTESGHTIADPIYERHCVIARVLMAIGTDEDTAYADACKIEHDLSEQSFQNIKRYFEKAAGLHTFHET